MSQNPYPQQPPYAGYPPPQKKSNVGKILGFGCLAIVVLAILGIGGCAAFVGFTANEVDKAIQEDANKPGGTDNPMTIKAGKAFEVDGFNYRAGWSVGADQIGDLDVKGLKVTNNRDMKDGALVEIKLWRGTEVVASSDCTSDQIDVGTTARLSCLSADKFPQQYSRITINDTF